MVNVSPTATHRARTGLRWGRVVLAALLLEVALFAVLVPLMSVIANPFTAATPDGSYPVFFATVPITCFAFAFAAGMWVARGTTNRPVLHGLLTGIVATIIYLALAAAQPGGLAPVIAGYGAWQFAAFNGLRIAGAAAGAAMKSAPAR